jgi:hypothetical protein
MGVSQDHPSIGELGYDLMSNHPTALHFKLALEDLESADSYEDVQFAYRPQLDESRDGALIDMLPDYLTEEITFPRHQASKFYARVMKSLMERSD